jgi:hypothetical protein
MVFGRVDGFVTEQDSFWHSESVIVPIILILAGVFILQQLEKVQSRLKSVRNGIIDCGGGEKNEQHLYSNRNSQRRR